MELVTALKTCLQHLVSIQPLLRKLEERDTRWAGSARALQPAIDQARTALKENGDAPNPPDDCTLRIEERLVALERDSHPPVDFGVLLEAVNRRLDALEIRRETGNPDLTKGESLDPASRPAVSRRPIPGPQSSRHEVAMDAERDFEHIAAAVRNDSGALAMYLHKVATAHSEGRKEGLEEAIDWHLMQETLADSQDMPTIADAHSKYAQSLRSLLGRDATRDQEEGDDG